LLLLLLRKLV